ncbi:hypothetical protein EK21DRAFT_93126 [Setomelanomma holmii]|uniref:Uncharacterized protein n=1 Tax=Setomelanomma holmii TaxID=210430 RepID=A0A9P4GZ83_9PLEO|nr:hypothetical protein EK21DRAFT_93126 [Setomelanomma holmii]
MSVARTLRVASTCGFQALLLLATCDYLKPKAVTVLFEGMWCWCTISGNHHNDFASNLRKADPKLFVKLYTGLVPSTAVCKACHMLNTSPHSDEQMLIAPMAQESR